MLRKPKGTRHIDLRTWLNTINLLEYETSFSGFDGVEDLLGMTEEQLIGLGVRSVHHRITIMTSLQFLAQKYSGGGTTSGRGKGGPRISTSFTPPCLVDHPDYSHTAPPPASPRLKNESPSPQPPLHQYPWFAGDVARGKAETAVKEEGDFVVRSSVSEPGQYVLTVCYQHRAVHFRINSYATRNKTEFIIEDKLFQSVPALVDHYVVSGAPLSQSSAAVIRTPVSLSPASIRGSASMDGLQTQVQSQHTPPHVYVGSLDRRKKHVPNLVGLPRQASAGSLLSPKPGVRPSLSSGGLRRGLDSRGVTVRPAVNITNKSVWDDDGRDYSDYDQVKSDPSWVSPGEGEEGGDDDYDNNPMEVHLTDQDYDMPKAENAATPPMPGDLPPPPMSPRHFSLTPEDFSSDLLPPDAKPLDKTVWVTIKKILLEKPVECVGAAILRASGVRLLRLTSGDGLGPGLTSGLQLIMLPHGASLAKAASDAWGALQYFVTACCVMSPGEACAIVGRWIHIAHWMYSEAGDLFSFTAVMAGLTTPQLSGVVPLWRAVQQEEPRAYTLLVNKLRPAADRLQAGAVLLPTHTVIPPLMPLLELLEATNQTSIEENATLDQVIFSQLDKPFVHLAAGREWMKDADVFGRRAEDALKTFAKFQLNGAESDMCTGEFQLRWLMGRSGSQRDRYERNAKFEQILHLLAKQVSKALNVA